MQKIQENNVKLSPEPELELELEPEPEPEQYYNTKVPPDVPPKSQCSDVVHPEEENLYGVAVWAFWPITAPDNLHDETIGQNDPSLYDDPQQPAIDKGGNLYNVVGGKGQPPSGNNKVSRLRA